ncbi:hypothetical protein PA01_01415 [Azoarcus sp. PA01]|nr:hypothetical protein PA01_01415 [Azoarcus sp. PA01]
MENTTTGMQGTMAGSAEKGAEKIEHLSSTAHEAVDRFAGAASSTLRHAGEKGQEWMATQEQMLEGARECVRRHPVASVMIAVGVGILFSRFTSH